MQNTSFQILPQNSIFWTALHVAFSTKENFEASVFLFFVLLGTV